MTYLRIAATLSLLLGLMANGSAEAMAVKCRETTNGIPIVNTRPLLVVDGELRGEVPPPGPDSTAIANIKRAEILGFYAICLEVMEAGAKVRRAAISVITKTGAVQFIKSQLQGLVDQQEEYRARTGQYARSLSSLEVVELRSPLVIDMRSSGGAWSANATLRGAPVGCQVAVRAVTGKAAPAVTCV